MVYRWVDPHRSPEYVEKSWFYPPFLDHCWMENPPYLRPFYHGHKFGACSSCYGWFCPALLYPMIANLTHVVCWIPDMVESLLLVESQLIWLFNHQKPVGLSCFNQRTCGFKLVSSKRGDVY